MRLASPLPWQYQVWISKVMREAYKSVYINVFSQVVEDAGCGILQARGAAVLSYSRPALWDAACPNSSFLSNLIKSYMNAFRYQKGFEDRDNGSRSGIEAHRIKVQVAADASGPLYLKPETLMLTTWRQL